MTSRACGYLVMLALLRQMAEKSTKSKSAVPFQVATMEELAEFNHVSNATGQVFRVLVANASDCAEGISFLAVRHVHLTEVPLSQGRFLQICGRALRMFGHESLPKDEQTVTYHLYVATLPSWMSSSLASSRTATATVQVRSCCRIWCQGDACEAGSERYSQSRGPSNACQWL